MGALVNLYVARGKQNKTTKTRSARRSLGPRGGRSTTRLTLGMAVARVSAVGVVARLRQAKACYCCERHQSKDTLW